MKYECTLIAVSDMERSKRFYHDILGLDVTLDLGANVTLAGGIALQTLETWSAFLGKAPGEIVFGHNAGELYFETEKIEEFAADLVRRGDVELIHPLKKHSWGQRIIRFYDPDRHVIEVGEAMTSVVAHFLAGGLSAEATSAHMDMPVGYVKACMEQGAGPDAQPQP